LAWKAFADYFALDGIIEDVTKVDRCKPYSLTIAGAIVRRSAPLPPPAGNASHSCINFTFEHTAPIA
jgi:hypothetical protein